MGGVVVPLTGVVVPGDWWPEPDQDDGGRSLRTDSPSAELRTSLEDPLREMENLRMAKKGGGGASSG